MLQINKNYVLDENNQPIAVQISLAEFEQIEEVLENYQLSNMIEKKEFFNKNDTLKYLELKNNQLNLSSIPTIEEMLNKLAQIQQENPIELDSIERVDRVNEI
ncbi:hypothetical protein ACN4EE_03575 [Geminocystis sp. CENA526]|uniref:hypothetical protein n=1 Tax=Geminocystis sp. CENA526 TaxID=1355871 RepID=UPI003D6EB084